MNVSELFVSGYRWVCCFSGFCFLLLSLNAFSTDILINGRVVNSGVLIFDDAMEFSNSYAFPFRHTALYMPLTHTAVENTTSATLELHNYDSHQSPFYEAGRQPIGSGMPPRPLPLPSASLLAGRFESFRQLASACANICIVWSQTFCPIPMPRYLPSTLSSPVVLPSQSRRYAPPPGFPSMPLNTVMPSGGGMPTPPFADG